MALISQHRRHCTVELQALPTRIRHVRRIVSAQLRYWRLDALIDRTALGVTELLTNVHQHAHPDKTCTVDIELLPDRLTVSVHDHDPRLPRVTETEAWATCGRGLAMIAAMCDSWGTRSQGAAGKVVWFTLPVPRAVSTAPLPVHSSATMGPFCDRPADHADLPDRVDLRHGRPRPLHGRAATRPSPAAAAGTWEVPPDGHRPPPLAHGAGGGDTPTTPPVSLPAMG